MYMSMLCKGEELYLYFLCGQKSLPIFLRSMSARAYTCRKDCTDIIQSLVYALTAVVIQFIVTCIYRCTAIRDNYLTMLLCLLIPHVILCGYVV